MSDRDAHDDADRDDDDDARLSVEGRWQIDVVGLPGWLWPPRVTGEPCVVMIVDADAGAVRAVSTGVREALPGLLHEALERASLEPPTSLRPCWPERVEVRDEVVARWLAEVDGPWSLETVARLPVLQAALDALFERLTPPPRFELEGIESALLSASAALVEAAPWRHYDESDVLVVEPAAGEVDWPVVSVVGAAGEVHGLVLHRSVADRRAAGVGVWQEADTMGIDSLVLWMFEASELSPDERTRYASQGYGRLDRYPVFSRLEADSGEVRSANAGERASLSAVLRALLAFVGAHPRPPGPGVVHRMSDGALSGATVRHVSLPSAAASSESDVVVDLRDLESLLVEETVLVPSELPRAVLSRLDEALDEVHGLPAGVIEALPPAVPVLVVRSRKRPMQSVVARVLELGIDGLMPVTVWSPRVDVDVDDDIDEGDGDGDDTLVSLALTRRAEPCAVLLDVGLEFAGLLAAHAQLHDGRLLVVFSGGGTRRLPVTTLRSRDVLCLRALSWIDTRSGDG